MANTVSDAKLKGMTSVRVMDTNEDGMLSCAEVVEMTGMTLFGAQRGRLSLNRRLALQ